MNSDIEISALGANGDGMTRLPNGDRLFVPGALPGERVRIEPTDAGNAHLLSVLRPSPDRVEPPCTLFGQCGGCAIQPLSLPAALDWKTGSVVHALERAGFADPVVTARFQSPPASRRRVDLAIRRRPDGVAIGLHARHGDVVDLTTCPVLAPALFALLPALRDVARSLGALRQTGDVLINLLDSGPDLLLATDGPLEPSDRAKLAAFARSQHIPRIAWRLAGSTDIPETAAQTGPVRHLFSGIAVAPPPGAFLQPTREGEAAIIAAALAALPRKLARRDTVIELYAGCGTLSFALGEKARLLAFEGHSDSVMALKRATSGTRVIAEQRDLNRQPIMARQLAEASAIVLDPPYMGAGAQMAQIVEGKPGRVIYVSCNPQALARDAAGLKAAGYRLDGVTIIDQFLWSTEVEAVCLFTGPPVPRRRTR